MQRRLCCIPFIYFLALAIAAIAPRPAIVRAADEPRPLVHITGPNLFVTWSGVQFDPSVASFKITRTEKGGPPKDVGTSPAGSVQFIDTKWPPSAQAVAYQVRALDKNKTQVGEFDSAPLDTPPAFDVIAPTAGAKVNSATPTLLWSQYDDDDRLYHLTIRRGSGDGSVVYDAKVRPQTSQANGDVRVYRVPGGELASSTPYVWQVFALDGPNEVPARNLDPLPSFDTGSNALQLQNAGFHLQRSFIDKKDPQGATLSFARSPDQDASYSSDFAVLYTPPDPVDHWRLFPGRDFADAQGAVNHIDDDVISFYAAIEGHVSSDPNPKISQHSLAAQAGLSDVKNWTREGDPEHFFGTYSTLGATYESSQRGDVQKMLASFRVIPISAPFAADIERSLPDWQFLAGNEHPITFMHEDNLGFDVGGTTRGRTTGLEREDDVLRLVAETRPQVRLNFLSNRIAGIKDVILYADDTFQYLVPERRGANFFQAGTTVQFAENFGLDVYYKIGRAAPMFQKVESLNVALSVKF